VRVGRYVYSQPKGDDVSKITQSAKGEQCQIRIPGVCNHNPETTVFCHYRLNTGIGIKPNDLQGAYGCSDCHSEADRRTTMHEIEFVKLCFAEGVFRTQAILQKKGLVKI
jgi:hypothetical protein